jgi:hypothetical protein
MGVAADLVAAVRVVVVLVVAAFVLAEAPTVAAEENEGAHRTAMHTTTARKELIRE